MEHLVASLGGFQLVLYFCIQRITLSSFMANVHGPIERVRDMCESQRVTVSVAQTQSPPTPSRQCNASAVGETGECSEHCTPGPVSSSESVSTVLRVYRVGRRPSRICISLAFRASGACAVRRSHGQMRRCSDGEWRWPRDAIGNSASRSRRT